MNAPTGPQFLRRSVGWIIFLAATAAMATGLATSRAAAAAVPVPIEQRDPWTAGDLIEPQALAKAIAGPSAERPVVYCVGFSMLYAGGHIPGAQYAGPASDRDGLELLKSTARPLSRDQTVVIYCGCCPWNHCPNIRPAFRALHAMGFRHVRVLVIPSNFHDDWTAQGLPVAHGEPAKSSRTPTG